MRKPLILMENGEAEFIEKKSKFIGYCKRTETIKEAEDFIKKIRKNHFDATHNVYAYQIGEKDEIQRFSDDGEPCGTAGKPILEVIKNKGLSQVTVVVTRYFGGTLLGTGGLVRAYSNAAVEALNNSKKAYLSPGEKICLFMDYEFLGKVENYLIRENHIIDHIEYQNNAAIYCIIEQEQNKEFLKKIKEHFPKGVEFTTLKEQHWITLPLNEK